MTGRAAAHHHVFDDEADLCSYTVAFSITARRSVRTEFSLFSSTETPEQPVLHISGEESRGWIQEFLGITQLREELRDQAQMVNRMDLRTASLAEDRFSTTGIRSARLNATNTVVKLRSPRDEFEVLK